ncbi:MAG TPA: carbohydrate kinase [Thermomicrobiales bacterium]|nr:carbohydrate kinase [Thermomicrobiales bacterium]
MAEIVSAEPERPADSRSRLLSLGETLIDLIVADGADSLQTASEFSARMGGAPANVAVALARLGAASAFCGVVGADPFGAKLRAGLAANGVDVSRLRSADEKPTSLAFAWKDDRGDGHFWLLRAADALLSPDDAERAGIPALAAIVVGSVALSDEPSRWAIERAVEIAADSGVPVCFDVNLRPTLWRSLADARAACRPILARTTLLKLSLDDARGMLDPDAAPDSAVTRLLADTPAALVVLTDGERGCWYATRQSPAVRHISALPVDAIEPTGAGDAFTAALLVRLLGRDWHGANDADLRYASAAGALATTKAGAWEGLPARAELDAFVAQSGAV